MESHHDTINDDEISFNNECVDEGSALLPDQSRGSTQNLLVPSRNMEPKIRPQVLTALAACFGAMAFGSVIGFASPVAPIFLSGEGGVNLTTNQNAWVSSSVTLGALLGGPIAGFTMSTIGRKMTLLGSCIPYSIGWGLIIGGQNFVMLLIGRLVCGLSIGISSVCVPTYLGEISSANIRGTLSALFQLMVTFGVLYGYSAGPIFDSFRLIGVVCAIPPVIHGLTMLFCKESPLFLFSKNRDNEAIEALQFLRGKDYQIQKEVQRMKDSIEESKMNKITISVMKKPYILKPFIIAILLMCFQQLSGINALLFNLSLIFQEAGTSIGYNLSAIIIGIVTFVFTAVSTVLIDRLGRRVLLQLSSFLMTCSLVVLGIYFYMKEHTDDAGAADLINNYGWLPLASLVGFMAAFSLGYGPIPWIMMGEMFFPNVKEIAASVATSCNWFFAFVTTVTFTMMKESIGSSGSYWLFAGICAINFVFCCFVVPETRGKTTEEITEMFGRESQPTDRTSEA